AMLLLACGVLAVQAVRLSGSAPPQRRIAVLPVQDESGDGTLAWSRVGLMGLMSGVLDQQGGIEVGPAQVVQSSVHGGTSTRASRAALGASHLVATTLRKVGSVYELEVHLVAAGNADRSETLHGTEPASLAADSVVRVRRWLDLDPAPTTNVAVSSPFL